MSKDPAFLFYSSDFLSGVQDLTMEERGVYITLLCLQHQKGRLTEKMIRLCHGIATADVMAKFRQDENGLFYNERLEAEIEKRRAHTEKQRKRAKEGWEKRKSDATVYAAAHTTADATALPLENENENENTNRTKDEIKEPRAKKIEPPDLREFLAYCQSLQGIDFDGLKFSLEAKHESWIAAGWKDGNGKAISNWKTKIKNTIPYLKPIYNNAKSGTKTSNAGAIAFRDKVAAHLAGQVTTS